MKKIMLLLLASFLDFSMQAQNVSVKGFMKVRKIFQLTKEDQILSSARFFSFFIQAGVCRGRQQYITHTLLKQALVKNLLTENATIWFYLENEYIKVTILPAFGG